MKATDLLRKERAFHARASSPWLSQSEAAARAGVSERTVRTWVTLKLLKKYALPSKGDKRPDCRFKVADVDALIEGATGAEK